MAITLSNLLARVKHYRKDLHSGEHLYALQVAARKLAQLAPLKSVQTTVTTVVGQSTYDVPAPTTGVLGMVESVSRISRAYRTSTGEILNEMNTQEAMAPHNLNDTGVPSRFGDRFGALVLYPAPEAVESITIIAETVPSLESEIVDMPLHAEEALVAGATYELMLIPGEGYNPTLAQHWAQRWVKEHGNYQGKVMMGTSGSPTIHIESPYSARTRNGSGTSGWMV